MTFRNISALNPRLGIRPSSYKKKNHDSKTAARRSSLKKVKLTIETLPSLISDFVENESAEL